MKITKNDLKELSRSEALWIGVIGSALGMLLLFVILQFVPQISSYTVTFSIAGLTINFFYGGGIPLIPGLIISALRRLVVSRLNFGVVYRMRQLGQRLVFVFLGLFAISIAASAIISWMYPSAKTSPYLGWIILASLSVLLIGMTVNYYGDVFTSNKLAALCFRQAVECKDPVSKREWITNALRHLREYTSEFREEMYTSEFQHLFAVRLLEGENIDTDLDNISKSLTDRSSLITTLNQIRNKQQVFSFITARKTLRERVGSYFEETNKYASFLGAIATILATLATLFMALATFLST